MHGKPIRKDASSMHGKPIIQDANSMPGKPIRQDVSSMPGKPIRRVVSSRQSHQSGCEFDAHQTVYMFDSVAAEMPNRAVFRLRGKHLVI